MTICGVFIGYYLLISMIVHAVVGFGYWLPRLDMMKIKTRLDVVMLILFPIQCALSYLILKYVMRFVCYLAMQFGGALVAFARFMTKPI